MRIATLSLIIRTGTAPDITIQWHQIAAGLTFLRTIRGQSADGAEQFAGSSESNFGPAGLIAESGGPQQSVW